MNCKLTSLKGNGTRTKEIEGCCVEKPKIGQRFKMYAQPLEGGHIRIIDTSPVKEIDGDVFKTENSIYRWEERK
jgi:hypothetical protein